MKKARKWSAAVLSGVMTMSMVTGMAMEHYLGVDVEVTFNRTPWADYRTNELVRLAGDDVADANTYSQGTAIQQYGEDGVVLIYYRSLV